MTFEEFFGTWDPAIWMRYRSGGNVSALDLFTVIRDFFRAPSEIAYTNAYRRAGHGAAMSAAAVAAITTPFPRATAAFNTHGAAARVAALGACQLTISYAKQTAVTQAVNNLQGLVRAGAIARFAVEAALANALAHVTDFNAYCTQTIGGDPGSTEDVRGFMNCLDGLVAGFRANWGGNFNQNNRNCLTAQALLQDVNALGGLLPANNRVVMEATLADNALVRWTRISGPTAAYFQDEVPAYRSRLAHINAMRLARAAAGAVVTLYRHVSPGEALAVIGGAMLNQGPAPLEKEKWFTTNPAAVGGGVVHGSLLTIQLRAGAFTALTGAASAALFSGANAPGQAWATLRTAANWDDFLVLLKVNEPTCFGIHEDALGVLNEFIDWIDVRNPSNAAPQRVPFNFVANYPVI